MQTITTKTATAAESILAIDLGKYKSVACLYGAADDVRFLSISTSQDELTRLLAKHRPAVVLIEACLLSSWVHDLCDVAEALGRMRLVPAAVQRLGPRRLPTANTRRQGAEEA